MRSTSTFAVILVGLVACSAPAAAWESRDDVHADSFGNLIVVAPSGYKRIVVGQGHLAQQLRSYGNGTGGVESDVSPEPDPADLEGIPEADADPVSAPATDPVTAPRQEARAQGRGCPAILVKGRSYMYGFDEGVIPLFGDRCL
jgi:hypothetical protein